MFPLSHAPMFTWVDARSLSNGSTTTSGNGGREEKNAVFSSGEKAAALPRIRDAATSSRRESLDGLFLLFLFLSFFFSTHRHRDLSPIIAPAARSFGVVARTRRQQ
jgi:hypothetical protein